MLAAAAKHVIDAGFDLKQLMRTILRSETYQRSSVPLAENRDEQKDGAMPDGDITTREALEAHYGQPKGHLSRKELPKLNQHSKHFIALSPFLVLSTSAANDGRRR